MVDESKVINLSTSKSFYELKKLQKQIKLFTLSLKKEEKEVNS